MDDDLTAALKAIHSGPLTNYVLYAELPTENGVDQVPLETVRLPLIGVDPLVAAERLRGRAKQTLRELKFDAEEINAAQIVLGLLPDDVTPILDTLVKDMQRGGGDLAFVDFLIWEGTKAQLGLAPKIVGKNDEEITYKGLRLRRRSAE